MACQVTRPMLSLCRAVSISEIGFENSSDAVLRTSEEQARRLYAEARRSDVVKPSATAVLPWRTAISSIVVQQFRHPFFGQAGSGRLTSD